jgi:hypothetical protein
VLIPETGSVTERLRVREIDDDEDAGGGVDWPLPGTTGRQLATPVLPVKPDRYQTVHRFSRRRAMAAMSSALTR